MKIFVSNTLKSIGAFLARHVSWITLALLAYIFLQFNIGAEVKTLIYAAMAVGLLVGLSSLVLFAYTIIPFSRRVIYGEDGKLNSVEAHSYLQFAGSVILAVAIVIGSIVIGYILQSPAIAQ